MKGSINRDLEELKNKHTNNTITEIKNSLEGIKSRISETEEWISELKDKLLIIWISLVCYLLLFPWYF